MKLDAFCLEDVRCFAGPQELRVRPLTFLVGENSTGKSTVLGCLQAVADYMMGVYGSEVDFNMHPYEMGSFRDIARRSRPLIQSFRLGVAFRSDKHGRARYTVELHERQGGARASVREVRWKFSNLRIVIRPRLERSSTYLHVFTHEDGRSFQIEAPHSLYARLQARPWMLPGSLLHDAEASSDVNAFRAAVTDHLGDLDSAVSREWYRCTSIAPIRSKPQRTYNPFLDEPDPEGSDVPAELVAIARRGGSKWHGLKAQLEEFGRDAGLFSEIDVRKLGGSGSDPFQLQVRARGSKVNIKDVGYGVSQILPILVRLAHPAERAGTVLIQQPEVHLHPRGQAALSSILIGLLNASGRRRAESPSHFVIETHSDYMIDRARIAIRRKQIRPEDVSLIYLEAKSRGGVTVHNLRFDEMGEMQGVPSGYRSFFLKESDALLGFGE